MGKITLDTTVQYAFRSSQGGGSDGSDADLVVLRSAAGQDVTVVVTYVDGRTRTYVLPDGAVDSIPASDNQRVQGLGGALIRSVTVQSGAASGYVYSVTRSTAA